MRNRVLATVFLVAPLWAQMPPPEFTAAGVVMGSAPVEILPPGSGGITIYGHHLGPGLAHSCTGTPDYQHPLTPNPRNPDPRFILLTNYPKELCGVQVWIGDKQAGLLYVAENQINLQIPQDSAESGTVEVRVVYQGRPGSVTLPAGFEKTTVSLDQPAYTNMPVWLNVKMPRQDGVVEYPDILGPAAFGCNDVEVRRNGQPLPRLAGSVWNDIGAFSGNACGTSVPVDMLRHRGRLPAHLLYNFAEPGTYEARFTRRDALRHVIAQSEWTPIVVFQSAPDQRAKWLDELRRAPPTDAAELVSDVLPSVMGRPDDASLAILLSYLHHPNRPVREYAIRGLHYWPDELVAAKLLESLHANGPTQQVLDRLLWLDPEFGKTHSAEIAELSLPYLNSNSPDLIGGAIDAIRRLRPPRDAALSRAMLLNADHVVTTVDGADAVSFIQLLAEEKSDQIHQWLWRYANPGSTFAQVIGEIARYQDPADLPKLGAMLIWTGNSSMARANSLSVLPETLYSNYGDAAIPYLERVVREWPAAEWLTRVSLKALLKAGDAEGYRFLEEHAWMQTEMYSYLRSSFPELKAASDDAVSAFVQERALAAR